MDTAVATRPHAPPAGNRQEMRPLPIRLAHQQYNRLGSIRDRSGISIQEHIRRAIDMYLTQLDREAMEMGLPVSTPTPRRRKR